MKGVLNKIFWVIAIIAAYMLIFQTDWVLVPTFDVEMKLPSIPTGCPYGDSVPMDMCQKLAPIVTPTPPFIQTDEPVINWSAAK